MQVLSTESAPRPWLVAAAVVSVGCGFGGTLSGPREESPSEPERTEESTSSSEAAEQSGSAGQSGATGQSASTPKVIQNPLPAPPSAIEFGLQAAPEPRPEHGGRVFLVSDRASLDAANAQAAPGDVIEVANGTYTSWDFRVRAKGSASKRLVVRPASPLGVTFSGSSQVRLDGEHTWIEGMQFLSTQTQALVIVGDNIRATRNTFRGCGTSGEETVRVLDFVAKFEFDNNEISDSYRQSIIAFSPSPGKRLFLGTQGHNFHHNYVHDIAKRVVNGAEVLTSINGNTTKLEHRVAENYGNRFEYNLVVDADGDGEYLSIKNGGWIIRYNRFVDCSGTLTLRGSSNSHIEGNQIIDSGGIRIAGNNHVIVNNHYSGSSNALVFHHGYDNPDGTSNYRMATENVIAHNTFRTSGRLISTLTKGAPLIFVDLAQDNLFVNNVFWKTNAGSWVGGGLSDTFLADNSWRHNIVWSDAAAYTGGDLPSGTENRNAAPGLSQQDGLYRPRNTDSAVVNAGESGVSPIDAIGASRDESPDIGAVEHLP